MLIFITRSASAIFPPPTVSLLYWVYRFSCVAADLSYIRAPFPHTPARRRTCYATSLLRHSQACAMMHVGKTNQSRSGGRWAVLITALTPSRRPIDRRMWLVVCCITITPTLDTKRFAVPCAVFRRLYLSYSAPIILPLGTCRSNSTDSTEDIDDSTESQRCETTTNETRTMNEYNNNIIIILFTAS